MAELVVVSKMKGGDIFMDQTEEKVEATDDGAGVPVVEAPADVLAAEAPEAPAPEEEKVDEAVV